MTPSNERSEPRAGKAMLYCPNCDHESHINGDWILEIRPDSVEYECPDCGTTINSRRNREELTARSGETLFVSADD